MAEKLLPCPFCGGTPKLRAHRCAEDTEECYVECPICEVRTAYFEDAYAPTADAAAAWNRRAGDLLAYYSRQIEWSRETFGPALRTKGVIDHIRKELVEIEREPHDLSEWIDVVILAMDGFWRHGGKAEDLMPALLAKQQKNMARVWPDWRTMSEDSAIEHDRSHDLSSKACGLADPSYHDCENMKKVGGGMDGERYRCDVCGKGYFLDYEEMK